MKNLAITLGSAVVLLCGLLYINHSRADRRYEVAHTHNVALSNQVTELSTRLVLETVKANAASSNAATRLGFLERRLLEVTNSLDRLQSRLSTAEHERSRIQGALAVRDQEIQSLRDQLVAAQANVEALNLEALRTAALHRLLIDAESRASALMRELGRMRIENAERARQIEDLDFLRLQTEKARDLAKAREAASKPGAAPDPRAPLALMPDGTVRVAPPSAELLRNAESR